MLQGFVVYKKEKKIFYGSRVTILPVKICDVRPISLKM